MVETVAFARGLLILLRLVMFGLTLGITLISFQAYRKSGSPRLQTAFIGFAFISMGVAVTNVITQIGTTAIDSLFVTTLLEIAETVPFIIGFAMLYLSLYR